MRSFSTSYSFTWDFQAWTSSSSGLSIILTYRWSYISSTVQLRHLLRLRDGARALLEAEAGDAEDTAELGQQRPALRGDYEAYVAKYGPLNRYTLRRTGREETVTDPMTGEPVLDPATGRPEVVETLARIRPRSLVTFRHDPHTSLVRALERFDEESQTSSPASLLTKRVVVPRPVKRGAETPSEAVALSLDETGRVDLAMIARLLGVDEAEARTRLGDLVYDDPVTGSLVHAPEYLSGDVRTKLDAATEAAALDERYAVNVEALREVLPDPIGVDEIEARLGAVLDLVDAYPQQFLAELLDDPQCRSRTRCRASGRSADAAGASGPPTIGEPTGDPRPTSHGP